MALRTSQTAHEVVRPQRRIVIVALEPVKSLELFALLEVFHQANRAHGGSPIYHLRIVSGTADRTVLSHVGVQIQTDGTYADGPDSADTLLVLGGEEDVEPVLHPELLAFFKRLGANSRRIASVCTGTFVLARAGLLNGRRATAHWKWSDDLLKKYPAIKLERDVIYVRDGAVYTSGGGTAGIDLALALVEEDLGRSVAVSVARRLLLFVRRSAGHPQLSATLTAQALENRPLADLLAWLPDHLREDHSVRSLARRVAMSPRNFARLFRSEIQTTPARHIEDLRLEAARRLLESTALSIEGIADAVGFSNCETLRRVFARRLRLTPGQYRVSLLSNAGTRSSLRTAPQAPSPQTLAASRGTAAPSIP